MICLTPNPSQSNVFFFTEKELFKVKGEWGLNKKRKEGFLTALGTAIKEDTTTSVRKQAN